MRRYLINEQIYFEMAIESCRRIRHEKICHFIRIASNREIRINTIQHNLKLMRELMDFTKRKRRIP